MSKMTGDLVQIGVAKETTRGTALAPAYELHWGDISLDDKIMTSPDFTRTGILEDSRDLKVIGKFAEGKIAAPVRDKSIGLFLASLFGGVANSNVSDSAYTHTFSVAESVQHQSLCLHRKDPNGGYDYPLAMISKFELDIGTDKHASFNADFRSKARNVPNPALSVTITIATPGVMTATAHGYVTGDAIVFATTDTLPTGLVAGTTYYVVLLTADTFSVATSLANALIPTKVATSVSQAGTHTVALVGRYFPAVPVTENVFLPQHCVFKTAATQSALEAASAVVIRSAKLSIDSKVLEDRNLGSITPTDIVNTEFSVKLEIEIVRNAETYVTALLAGTAYAVRLDLNNTDVLIGTTSTPRLYFELNQAILEDASTPTKKGDLTTQTLSFKATYKESDSSMIKAYLINSVATVV